MLSMILQPFNSGMLTNEYAHNLRLSAFITLLVSLMSTLNITCAHAESSKSYRQQPISPVHQVIEVDEARAQLGGKLFFNTRLSFNNTVAYASFHQLNAVGDDNVVIGLSLPSTGEYNKKPLDL
jgi:cytochrome c peroxidase